MVEFFAGSMGSIVSDGLPIISVVIPMRNEENHISQCLQSIVSQDYPKELMEVLVVDGMSEDSSREIVADFARRYPHVKLLRNPDRVTTIGLNRGILESKGQVIARVDAHCTIDHDYISSCVKALKKSGAENVGGLMRPAGKTFMEEAISFAMSCPFGVGCGKFHYCEMEMFVDTVYLGAYKREVFEKIGLFDEEAHYSEDDELNYRLIKSGGKVFLTPTIRSKYQPRSSLRALWRQYYNYGCGKARTIKKHGKPASWRHLAPVTFMCSVAGSLMLVAVNPLFAWLSFGMLGSYLLLASLFSARISIIKGWRYFPVLPIVFATLHLSYGTGFLKGILGGHSLDGIRERTGPGK